MNLVFRMAQNQAFYLPFTYLTFLIKLIHYISNYAIYSLSKYDSN